MSTCSTATSAHVHTCPSCRTRHVHGSHLERRLRDLEQDWDAYKARRAAAPASRHRRSRSATDRTSSSAVTAVPGFLKLLRGSPTRLVRSLQQVGSSSTTSAAGAGAVTTVEQGKTLLRHRQEEGVSSVSSEEAGSMAAAASLPCSCSCSRECTVLFCGYSSSSSCSAAASLFSLREGGNVVGDLATNKGQEERWLARVGRFAAIALAVVVLGAMAMAILEFAMDGGCVEFLVPT